MSISSLFAVGQLLSQLTAPSSTNQTSAAAAGSPTSSVPTGVTQPGTFATALAQALRQVGLTGTASGVTASGSSAATASSAGSQALQAFTQSLYAALAAQNPTATQAGAAAQPGTGTSVGSGGHHHHGHGLRGEIASLIQQLDASNAGGASSSTPATGTPLANLQQNYTHLVSALGGSSASGATLDNLLRSLAANLPSAQSAGGMLQLRA